METSQDRIKEYIERQHGPNEDVDLIDTFVRKQSQRSLSKRLSFESEIDAKTAPTSSRDSELGTVATSLLNLRNEFLILYQVLERKITYLATSSTCAFSNDDHLLLVLCGRGLIGNTASVAYLIKQTNETFERIEAAAESGPINEDIEQLCHTYRRRFYATRFFDCAAIPESLNIPALVHKYLASDIEGIKEHYEYLLGFVQPIFDCIALDSDQGSGEASADPRIAPSIEKKQEIMQKALRIASMVVECADRQLEVFASSGLMIDAYAQKSLDPSTTLATLFAERPAYVPGEEIPEEAAKEMGTFFSKDGKVWLRLSDGTSFETPLKSVGDVTPEQEVTVYSREGKTWLNLDDGTSFETPLEPVTTQQTATFFDKDGKVWLKLGDGTSFATPLKSIGDVAPEEEVTLFSKDSKVWVGLDDGKSFETPLKSLTSEQGATLFDKEGKVWLRLGDGTSFVTPLESMENREPVQIATLLDKDGEVALRLSDGTSLQTPLRSTSTRQMATFFDKDGRVWLRLPDGTAFATPLKSIGEAALRQQVTFFDRGGKTWLTIGHGVSFETPLKSLTSRQIATFFDKDGKVWARLGDGTAFVTPLKSIGDVTAKQSVMLFTRRGHIWLRLDRGPAFETPLDSVSPRRTHLFFSKKAKVWFKYGEKS